EQDDCAAGRDVGGRPWDRSEGPLPEALDGDEPDQYGADGEQRGRLVERPAVRQHRRQRLRRRSLRRWSERDRPVAPVPADLSARSRHSPSARRDRRRISDTRIAITIAATIATT